MKDRGLAIPLSFIAGAVLLAACVDIPTSSNSVLSFQFAPLAAPAVVVGDSLRDSLGIVTPIRVNGFNFQGDSVTQLDVRFSAVDRGIRVDSLTGIVIGDSARSSARVFASVKGLTGSVTLGVTLRPDSVAGSNAIDSLSYSLIDSLANVSNPLGVRVAHKVAAGDAAVSLWRVSFKILSPSDTALAALVRDDGVRSSLDTTDAAGIGARRIKVDVKRLTSLVDSVIVQAFVKYRGVNVAGSPVRLVLKVKPKA